MQSEIIIYGTIALIMWIFIFAYSFRNSNLRWASPACLTSAGLLSFYIVPSLYWQLRPWTYYQYHYFDGLHLVMISACLFGLPFIIGIILGALKRKGEIISVDIHDFKFNKFLWIFFFILLFGIAWRIYLLTLGWQGRFVREAPAIAGSEDLALIVFNLTYFYAACYFALAAFGNRAQKKAGIFLWIIDGFFQLFLIHRYWIYLYVFRSTVFLIFLGLKMKLRHWVAITAFGIFVMAVIGQSHIVSHGMVSGDRPFLSVTQVIDVIKETTSEYKRGAFEGDYGSSDPNIFLRALDDTMYRLYDARSASALMMSTPDIIPYFYGGTLVHALYSLVPRYFWPDKPHLEEIHNITKWVMKNESGTCSTGTLAELYMNYGFIFVFLGGIAYFFVCLWFENYLKDVKNITPAWICMYPILAEQFLLANHNFTQRGCETIRGLLVLALIALIFSMAKKRFKRDVQQMSDKNYSEKELR